MHVAVKEHLAVIGRHLFRTWQLHHIIGKKILADDSILFNRLDAKNRKTGFQEIAQDDALVSRDFLFLFVKEMLERRPVILHQMVIEHEEIPKYPELLLHDLFIDIHLRAHPCRAEKEIKRPLDVVAIGRCTIIILKCF